MTFIHIVSASLHCLCLCHCLSLSISVSAYLSLSLPILLSLSPPTSRPTSRPPSPSLSSLPLHNLHKVQQASADDLPFEDRSYDRYVANLCLMLVPDFPKSVSEAARVLRPGGMLGATLWGDRAKSPFFTIQPKVRNLCVFVYTVHPRELIFGSHSLCWVCP